MYDATRDAPRRGPLTQTYFAYGSNLDAAQMRARCPSAKLLGAAILDGYRLGFAGQSAHVCVKDAAEQSLPTEAYFGVLWQGYRKHGFDELALAMAHGDER